MTLATVEDLIIHLSEPINGFDRKKLSPKDQSILFSMRSQLQKKLALTEKQAQLSLKIISENIHHYKGELSIQPLLDLPIYKYPFRVIDKDKKIFIFNNNAIAIKYPYNKSFNKFLNESARKQYNHSFRGYELRLTEKNIKLVVEFFKDHNFIIDDKLINWYKEIISIKENACLHVPSVVITNDRIELVNSNSSIQNYFDKNKTNVIEQDLFLTKIMNLYLSTEVTEKIQNLDISQISKKYLTSSINPVNVSKISKNDICLMLKELNTYPALFIIEENLAFLDDWITSFRNNSINNNEISVLFRSNTDKEFNNYIKNQQLNNMVDNNTKVVIVKNKLPKILYKINFEPKIIITYNDYFRHSTNKKIVDSHPAVLYYSDIRSNIGINIANL